MAPPTQPTQPAPERLEVPTLPPPSSRFVLPPPPSALLDRLQAFLPQIRDANAHLDPPAPGAAPGDEAVVMEEITDSSDDDSSTDDSSSSSSDSDDNDEASSQGGEASAAQQQGDGAVDQVSPAAGAEDDRAGTLAHLLDISARPTVVRSKLLVQEEPAAGAGEGADEMQAD